MYVNLRKMWEVSSKSHSVLIFTALIFLWIWGFKSFHTCLKGIGEEIWNDPLLVVKQVLKSVEACLDAYQSRENWSKNLFVA